MLLDGVEVPWPKQIDLFMDPAGETVDNLAFNFYGGTLKIVSRTLDLPAVLWRGDESVRAPRERAPALRVRQCVPIGSPERHDPGHGVSVAPRKARGMIAQCVVCGKAPWRRYRQARRRARASTSSSPCADMSRSWSAPSAAGSLPRSSARSVVAERCFDAASLTLNGCVPQHVPATRPRHKRKGRARGHLGRTAILAGWSFLQEPGSATSSPICPIPMPIASGTRPGPTIATSRSATTAAGCSSPSMRSPTRWPKSRPKSPSPAKRISMSGRSTRLSRHRPAAAPQGPDPAESVRGPRAAAAFPPVLPTDAESQRAGHGRQFLSRAGDLPLPHGQCLHLAAEGQAGPAGRAVGATIALGVAAAQRGRHHRPLRAAADPDRLLDDGAAGR